MSYPMSSNAPRVILLATDPRLNGNVRCDTTMLPCINSPHSQIVQWYPTTGTPGRSAIETPFSHVWPQ